jgi:hypothetical protein
VVRWRKFLSTEETSNGYDRKARPETTTVTSVIVYNSISFRPSHSEFGSQNVFCAEVDGSLRLCIDYRGINEATHKDAYPLPRVDDTLDELKDTKSCIYFDLASVFCKFEFVKRTFTRVLFAYLTV